MGDGAGLFELVPDVEVGRGSMSSNCVSILVCFIEDELGGVLLVLHHVEAVAARLQARTLCVVSDGLLEIVESVCFHLNVNHGDNWNLLSLISADL